MGFLKNIGLFRDIVGAGQCLTLVDLDRPDPAIAFKIFFQFTAVAPAQVIWRDRIAGRTFDRLRQVVVGHPDMPAPDNIATAVGGGYQGIALADVFHGNLEGNVSVCSTSFFPDIGHQVFFVHPDKDRLYRNAAFVDFNVGAVGNVIIFVIPECLQEVGLIFVVFGSVRNRRSSVGRRIDRSVCHAIAIDHRELVGACLLHHVAVGRRRSHGRTGGHIDGRKVDDARRFAFIFQDVPVRVRRRVVLAGHRKYQVFSFYAAFER